MAASLVPSLAAGTPTTQLVVAFGDETTASPTSYYHAGLDVCSHVGSEGADASCARSVVLTILGVATLFLCIYKVVRIHQGNRIEWRTALVFYLATLQILLLTIEWAVGGLLAAHFVALYLHVNQFVLISLFYGGLATKVVHRPTLIRRVIIPTAIGICTYFFAVLVYALVTAKPNFKECIQAHWLLFSGSAFVLAQIFLVATILLLRELKRFDSRHSIIRHKRYTLITLTGIFEYSSIVNFAFDVAAMSIAQNEDCDAILGSPGSSSFAVSIVFLRVSVHLMPIWVMAFLLRPVRPRQEISPRTSTFAQHDSGPSSQAGPMVFDDFDYTIDPKVGQALNTPLLADSDGHEAAGSFSGDSLDDIDQEY